MQLPINPTDPTVSTVYPGVEIFVGALIVIGIFLILKRKTLTPNTRIGLWILAALVFGVGIGWFARESYSHAQFNQYGDPNQQYQAPVCNNC